MDWGQPKVNRTLLPRFCCPKFLHCQNFPLPTWWNLNHTDPQEMLLLWPRSPLLLRGNELQVTLHWSDSLCLHTGCFFQSCHFLAETPFLLFWTSLLLALKQFLWEAFVHKCLWHSVSCSQCLLVCLLQPRAWQRVCIMSLGASNVHCSDQMLHTRSFLLINQIQETETFLNWKTLEIEDSFTL